MSLENSIDAQNKIITVEILASAIQNSYENLSCEQAEEAACTLLNIFGFSDRIIDNMLQNDERDLFYMYEDRNLLRTEREETNLYDGRAWRIYYWILQKNGILELANHAYTQEPSNENLYAELPDKVWKHKDLRELVLVS